VVDGDDVRNGDVPNGDDVRNEVLRMMRAATALQELHAMLEDSSNGNCLFAAMVLGIADVR
jgi:hypothetical protein